MNAVKKKSIPLSMFRLILYVLSQVFELERKSAVDNNVIKFGPNEEIKTTYVKTVTRGNILLALKA